MERDINRQSAETLVRQITQERQRFLSAWEQGARSPELNQIRQHIKQLNELLWETTISHSNGSDVLRSGYLNHSDPQNFTDRSKTKP
ncbi:MAG: hypothetical protein ACXWCG_00095 [Flavitalea sp.]